MAQLSLILGVEHQETAAARAERGEGNLGFISAASKCMASDVAMEVTTDAVQLFGGMGYMAESEIERQYRDMRILGIGGGTTEILTSLAAKTLGYQA
mgnify:CR=1 FL=1